MSTEKRYKNPPIVEALCEIHFEEDPKWNSTFFGRFHQKIENEFPQAEEAKGIEVGFQLGPEGLSQQFRKLGTRMRFRRKDQTALAQLAENLLAVNVLPKYPGWHEFKPLILARLKDYIAVIQPKAILRIGLRYINRIKVPEADFEFGRYFANSCYLPPEVYQFKGPFLVRLELSVDDESRLNLTVSRTKREEDGLIPVIVDLDHITFRHISPPTEGGADAVLEAAHSKIISAFESIIGDELRQRFEPED